MRTVVRNMANLISIVILTLLIVVTVDGDSCCTPDQWEGSNSLAALTCRAGAEEGRLDEALFLQSYDNINEKLALNLTDAGGTQKWIADQTTKMFYHFNTTNCVKGPITIPWEPFCVDGKNIGGITFGTGKNTLSGVTYASTEDGIAHYFTVTKDNCTPVGAQAVGTVESSNTSLLITSGYFNVTLGIKDPSVFTPPSFCSSIEEDQVKPTAALFARVVKMSRGGY